MYKQVYLLFLMIFTSVAAPPGLVFRAVQDAPEMVKSRGGFTADGADGLRPDQPPPDISLFDHVRGDSTGFASYNSGYVSTTVNSQSAYKWIINHYNRRGYIYYIKPSGNFININLTLRQFTPYDTKEYAVLGMIRWQQIIGWRQVVDGYMQSFRRNPDYNKALFKRESIGGGEPQLAGFPQQHEAWSLDPWRKFATCTQHQDVEVCVPAHTAQEQGEKFYLAYMRKNIINFILVY